MRDAADEMDEIVAEAMRHREQQPWRLSPVNKSLLDTDILSEIGKGIDPNVARNAAAYRNTFGRYTLSVISIMEIVRGWQKKQNARRLQRFLASIASEEILSLRPARR